MKSTMPEQMNQPTSNAPRAPHDPRQPSCATLAPRGPIEFRFILRFAAQMSTPCSRGQEIEPRADYLLSRPAPRMFQNLLQRHGVLQ